MPAAAGLARRAPGILGDGAKNTVRPEPRQAGHLPRAAAAPRRGLHPALLRGAGGHAALRAGAGRGVPLRQHAARAAAPADGGLPPGHAPGAGMLAHGGHQQRLPARHGGHPGLLPLRLPPPGGAALWAPHAPLARGRRHPGVHLLHAGVGRYQGGAGQRPAPAVPGGAGLRVPKRRGAGRRGRGRAAAPTRLHGASAHAERPRRRRHRRPGAARAATRGSSSASGGGGSSAQLSSAQLSSAQLTGPPGLATLATSWNPAWRTSASCSPDPASWN